jgi:hypothetical protein
MPRKRKPRKKSARVSPAVEQQIVEISLQYPGYGARQSAESQSALPLQIEAFTELESTEQIDPDPSVAGLLPPFNLKREDVEKSLSDLAELMERLNISPNAKADQSAGSISCAEIAIASAI